MDYKAYMEKLKDPAFRQRLLSTGKAQKNIEEAERELRTAEGMDYTAKLRKENKAKAKKKEKETIKQVHKKTDDYLTEHVKKHNKTNIKLQSEKAEKIMKEMQDLMDEVSAFEIPKPAKKPKLPKAVKKALEEKPKKKSKAQLEREMVAENNKPEVQGRKRIKYLLDKLSVNVQMMENAVEAMKKVSKDAYEASSEIKELYKTNKKLFEKYKEEGEEELAELKTLSKVGFISPDELEKLMVSSNAGKNFDEFKKYKKYKPKF